MSQLSEGRIRRATPVLVAIVLASGVGLTVSCGDDSLAGVARSELMVSPDVLSFNASGIGISDTQFLTITNVGSGELVITGLELVTQSREFSMSEVAFPIRLGEQEQRVIEVSYTPQDCRSDRGRVIVRSNDVDLPVPLEPQDLTGTVFINPDPVDFGRVPAGVCKTVSVNVTNSGTCALSVNDLFITGSAEFEFTEVAGDGFVSTDPLAAGEIFLEPAVSRQVDITYCPANDGFDEAVMLVRSDDAATRTREVDLFANGDQACIVVSEEPLIDFGSRFIGETHPKTITITNCSQRETLLVSEIDLGEHWELDGDERYSLSDLPDLSSPLSLEPSENASFLLSYAPIQYTPETNPACGGENCEVPDGTVLTVVSNDEFKSPLDIEVRGIGTNNHCPVAVAKARVQTSGGPWDTQIDTIPLATLEFDGRNSTDQEGGIAGYLWEVSNRPSGSVATFAPNAELPNPTFFLDLAGTYLFTLRVFDEQGVESCDPAEVTAIVVPNEAIHVQLVWETDGDPNRTDVGAGRGSDVDLHFMHPNGTWDVAPWDCYWRNKEPNWASSAADDNPSLDIDDTDGWGPENINLDNPEGTGAAPVIYKVGVFYFSDHGFGVSDTTVRIFISGVERFASTFPNLGNRQFWDVARISWPDGGIERIHRLYPSGFP